MDDLANSKHLDQSNYVLGRDGEGAREHEDHHPGRYCKPQHPHLPTSAAEPIIEGRAIRHIRTRNPGGSAVSVDLVLAGNGPGELTGWVRPVARSARDIGPADLRLTLVLSPTQFAGGREVDVVKSWGLFDRILTPAEGIRLALGGLRLEAGLRGSSSTLGEVLWFSPRLPRLLRFPPSAFQKTFSVPRS